MKKQVYFNEVAQIGAGQSAPQDPSAFIGKGKPFIRAGSLDDLCKNGSFGSLEQINILSANKHKMRLYPAGTIVFAKSGMSATKDRVFILPSPAYIVSHLSTIILNLKECDPSYIRFFWMHYKPSNLIKDEAYPSISAEDIGNVGISLPPLPEQQRIAAILQKADRLRQLRRYARQLSDSYLQSVFLEMFGDPVVNQKDWNLDCLANFCQPKNGIKAGPFGSSLKKEFYSKSGYRIYGQEQVIGGDFKIGDYYISKELFDKEFIPYEVKPFDILISLVGTFGKTIIVPDGIEPGIINPRLLKISPRKEILNSVFLSKLLQFPSVQKQLLHLSHGGTMGILNAGQLKEYRIICPPLPVQEEFANHAGKHEGINYKQLESERQTDMLFQSLLVRAFQGEL